MTTIFTFYNTKETNIQVRSFFMVSLTLVALDVEVLRHYFLLEPSIYSIFYVYFICKHDDLLLSIWYYFNNRDFASTQFQLRHFVFFVFERCKLVSSTVSEKVDFSNFTQSNPPTSPSEMKPLLTVWIVGCVSNCLATPWHHCSQIQNAFTNPLWCCVWTNLCPNWTIPTEW